MPYKKGTIGGWLEINTWDKERDKKEGLLGLLNASSAYASDVARKMKGSSTGVKEMRVLRFVHHPKLSYDKLLCAHIQRLSGLIGGEDKLRIYGDISELVKPWAKRMDVIDTVRDGSDPMEKKGRIIPVVFYPN